MGVLAAIWEVGSTCVLGLVCFGAFVRSGAGFSGLHFSACDVSCEFSCWLCVLVCHSAGGAVSCFRWWVDAEGRSDPGIQGGTHGCQG